MLGLKCLLTIKEQKPRKFLSASLRLYETGSWVLPVDICSNCLQLWLFPKTTEKIPLLLSKRTLPESQDNVHLILSSIQGGSRRKHLNYVRYQGDQKRSITGLIQKLLEVDRSLESCWWDINKFYLWCINLISIISLLNSLIPYLTLNIQKGKVQQSLGSIILSNTMERSVRQ